MSTQIKFKYGAYSDLPEKDFEKGALYLATDNNDQAYLYYGQSNSKLLPIIPNLLDVGHGGTGLNSSPSMLVDLGSTSADTILKASPRPGVTGILGVSNGGTGQITGRNAANYFINELETGNSVPEDNDYYISQYVGGSKTTYHRRPMSKLYAYIKEKINTDGNALTATKLQTARTIQTNLASTTAASFDGSEDVQPGVTGILGTANGGTGVNSHAGNKLVWSNNDGSKIQGNSHYADINHIGINMTSQPTATLGVNDNIHVYNGDKVKTTIDNEDVSLAYVQILIRTEGNSSTTGVGTIRLGNTLKAPNKDAEGETIAGDDNNARGRLTIYSTNEQYNALQTRDNLTHSGYVYLPAPQSKLDNQYLVWSQESSTAIGSERQPVYISNTGEAIACSSTTGVSYSKKIESNRADTWYRIAETNISIGKCTGLFSILAKKTKDGHNYHTSCNFYATTTYGLQNHINILSNSNYGNTQAISKIRIVYPKSYSNNKAYLEVYLTDGTENTTDQIDISLTNNSGWILYKEFKNTDNNLTDYVTKEISITPNYLSFTQGIIVNNANISSQYDNNASDSIVYAKNSAGSVGLFVNGDSDTSKLTIGNRGLYDLTRDSWMLYYNEENNRQQQSSTYFTGNPYIANSSYWPSLYFTSSNSGEEAMGRIAYGLSDEPKDTDNYGELNQQPYEYNRFYFYQYFEDKNEDNRRHRKIDCEKDENGNIKNNEKGEPISYVPYDRFYFPKTEYSLESDGTEKGLGRNSYKILTTKELVTISQGGTGKDKWENKQIVFGDNSGGLSQNDAIQVNTSEKFGSLWLGNDNNTSNKYGAIRIYDTAKHYNLIKTVDSMSANRVTRLRDWGSDGYLVATNTTNAVGNTDTPVYVDNNGVIEPIEILSVGHGGTGKKTHTLNSVLTGNGTSAVNNVATASGAFYATSANGAPQFGTLPIGQGGTGLTSSPSMLVNLESTSADTILKASPRPGVTGTLGVSNGGTGCDDGTDAANYFINQLSEGNSVPEDNDFYISQYVGGSKTTYHRRPMSKLYAYIKGKINVSNKNATLDWATASTIATIAGTNITITMPANPNTDESVYQSQATKTVYRPLLMHCNYSAAYGGNPGNATNQVYYNETIAACPGRSQLIARTFAVASSDNNRGLYDLTRDTWMLYYNKTNERQEQITTYFTGELYLSDGDYRSNLYFKPNRFDKTAGFIRYATEIFTKNESGESERTGRKGQFQFYQYGYSAGTSVDARTDNYELFYLPRTDPDISGKLEYKILTNKELVTVGQGGTGCDNGTDAANYFISQLSEGTTAPIDDAYYISEYSGTNSTLKGLYYRRKHSDLYEYIKGKINTDGNASTATKLQTARTIRTNLASTTAVSFDGSGNVQPGVTGTLGVSNGGTGVTSHTGNRLVWSNSAGTTIQATNNHYVDATHIGINMTSKPTTALGVNGAIEASSYIRANNANVSSYYDTATDSQVYARNSKGQVSLFVNDNGNRGLYDYTGENWMLYYNVTNQRQQQSATYFAGNPYIANSSYWPSIYFTSSNVDESPMGIIAYGLTDEPKDTNNDGKLDQQPYKYNRFYFSQYSYIGNTRTRKTDTDGNPIRERFRLPQTAAGLTESADYNILTTKQVKYGNNLPGSASTGDIFFLYT